MIEFDTESGSTYEVDRTPSGPDKSGRIRRLIGTREPTPRQGTDGEWKDFYHLTPVVIGKEGVLVFWDEKGKATLTSPVTEIRETEPTA